MFVPLLMGRETSSDLKLKEGMGALAFFATNSTSKSRAR